MQTYSHLIVTAALRRGLKGTKSAEPHNTFLWGAILPDVPLILLSLGFFVWRRHDPVLSQEFVFGSTYDTLYFTNPWWIAGHNLFHAPLMLGLYALAGWLAERRGHRWGRALIWFAAGCGLHSLIDILTHVNDGPLLFFPFDWRTRFAAPVSYWDPNHGGRLFSLFEHSLNLVLLLYLGIARRRENRPKK